MPILSGPLQIAASDARETSETPLHKLGTVAFAEDGSLYRYSQAGSSNLASGILTVAATQTSGHENLAVAADAAVGDFYVVVTLGATTLTKDYYVDGYLVVNDGTGEGVSYRISANPASAGSEDVVITLLDPLTEAITTTSEVSLVANPQKAVVISATDQADFATGFTNVSVTAEHFFWAQTRGVVSVLADEVVTAGLSLTIGTGVAGAVEAADAAGEQIVGRAFQALVDTEYRAIFATID